jgi:DNA topoisomerase III
VSGTITRLIVAEKESQASAIAAYLGDLAGVKPIQGPNNEYVVATGDVVVFASGHLFEDAKPEDYDARYETWRREDLPIVPKRWKRIPKKGKTVDNAFAALRRYLPVVESVLHACDMDREGQLIGDEIFREFKVAKPINRLPIVGFDEDSLAAAFAAIHPNDEHKLLSAAAIARSRGDWLWGTAFSRLLTILAQAKGHRKPISAGRVISPTQYIIYEREHERRTFIPVHHFAVVARIETAAGPLKATWVQPNKEGQNDNKQLVRRAIADEGCERIAKARIGKVLKVEPQDSEQQAPLPFSLAPLQADINSKYGYTIDAIYDAADALYRKHALITYHRANNRYYPTTAHARAPGILDAIRTNLPVLTTLIDGADPALQSQAFDDSKSSAEAASHHGIMPLRTTCAIDTLLSPVERDVYEAICRNYIAQFYPPMRAEQLSYTVIVGSDALTGSRRVVVDPGWYPVLGKDVDGEATLPEIEPGEDITVSAVVVDEKRTEPPKRFTDGSLILALNDVQRVVKDPDLKKLLGEGARLGTEATQTQVVKKLLATQMVERQDRYLTITGLGAAIAKALPPELKGPALTALFERGVDEIARGERTMTQFIEEQIAILKQILPEIGEINFEDAWKPRGAPGGAKRTGTAGGMARTKAS